VEHRVADRGLALFQQPLKAQQAHQHGAAHDEGQRWVPFAGHVEEGLHGQRVGHAR